MPSIGDVHQWSLTPIKKDWQCFKVYKDLYILLHRIELIEPDKELTFPDETTEISPAIKLGLMACSNAKVIDAWFDKLRGPNKRQGGIPRNAKFYFTELGWKEVGRYVVEACQQTGQEYRVIKVKEETVNVVWRDRYYGLEVAAQPKKPLKR